MNTNTKRSDSLSASQIQKAIIYCRVSSKKQSADGAGLASQEYRCRQYAEARGLQVEAVFPDDVSDGGDFINRPGMVALLAYLEACKDTNFVIVFDDMKRYSRDIEFHKKLRRTLDAHGARPECLNFRFEDTPEGEFIETIIAVQGELERKQNRRQVLQKMKARVEQGYRYVNAKGGGKVLVRDEPIASIVQEALEGYASGRFGAQSEVQRFLEAEPEFSQQNIHPQRVKEMLTHPLYAGCVRAIKWDVALRNGHHEGLISYAAFERTQERLKSGGYAPARKDIGKAFALRGFVTCADCNSPLYSSFSKSRTGKRHPYYLCQTRACEFYGKSIRRDKLERERLIGHDRLDQMTKPNSGAAEKPELRLEFLSIPWKIWENGDQTMRTMVLKLAFADRLAYCQKAGPKTPKITLLFKVLGGCSRGSNAKWCAREDSNP